MATSEFHINHSEAISPDEDFASMILHRPFQKQAEWTPDAIAIIYREEVITYRQLNNKANELAALLLRHHVDIEQTVGIYVYPSPEFIVSVLAVLKIGGVVVPLSPGLSQNQLGVIISDAGINLILAGENVPELLSSYNGEKVRVDIKTEEDSAIISNPGKHFSADNLCAVFYTSGTTGRPKGIMYTHLATSMAVTFSSRLLKLQNSDRHLCKSSMAFAAIFGEIFGALNTGGSLVIADHKNANDLDYIFRLIKEKEITIAGVTPAVLPLLCEESNKPDCRTLRIIVSSGEGLNAKTQNECLKNTHAEIHKFYGLSEAPCIAHAKCQVEKIANRTIVGAPTYYDVYILGDDLHKVPDGEKGEIYVSGPLTRGYLNQPELTSERYIPDPFSLNPGTLMLKTGDLGRWHSDGNIEFLGRVDHQVKIRGFRIELAEIEHQLLRHPLIEQAVVVVREDEPGDKILVAYLVSREPLRDEELRDLLSDFLPEYMIPSFFVTLDKLPLTTNGKVDRAALPVPDTFLQQAYTPPATPTEEKLTRIWAEVLGLKKEQISTTVSFFDLGGHSLKGLVAAAKIRKEFEVPITIQTIFTKPRIIDLARDIGAQSHAVFSPIPKAPNQDYYPLTPAQQRMYILDHLAVAGTPYNNSLAFKLEGALDKEKLEKAFRQIIQRHDAFRTSFVLMDDQPVQAIAEALTFEIGYVDKGADNLYRLIEAFIRPFDLSKAPLLRVQLISVGRQEHVLLLDMHHIISDGISLAILFQELSLLYRDKALEPVNIQYRDYAVWLQQEARGAALQQQKQYWQASFPDIPVLNLPTDHPRPAMQRFEGDRIEFMLPEHVSEPLRSLCGAASVTMYMKLFAAFNILLSKYSGDKDIVVGCPTAGRNHADIQSVVGVFINTLPVRTSIDVSESYNELLGGVKENILNALANQDYQLEELIEVLDVERDLSRNPLFDVMFVFQNFGRKQLELEHISISPINEIVKIAKFDLSLIVFEAADQIKCFFEYSTSLFNKETIVRLRDHFLNVLEEIVAYPDKAIGKISIVSEAERHQLLYGFNDTERDYPQDKAIAQLFEEQVLKTPDHIAVVFEEEELTYRELNARANQLAHYLRSKGVREETLVPVCIERSIGMIVGILGILKAGGAYVPIDPEYPEERIRYLLEDTKAAIAISSKQAKVKLTFREGLEVIAIDRPEALLRESTGNPGVAVAPSRLAYVIYTSGSTGRPKGVMVEHTSLVNYLLNQKACYMSNEVRGAGSFIHLSHTFDASLTGMFMPLLSGKSIVIGSGESVEVFEDPNLWKHAPYDFIKVTPLHLPLLQARMKMGDGSLLTGKVVIGGEALRPGHFEHLIREGVDIEIINEYGPTEATVGCSTYGFRTLRDKEKIRRGIPIGKPIDNARLYIVNGEQQLSPVGVTGELCVGGVGVARGYLNQEALTAEKFIADPFSKEPGARLYRTGDLARWLPDGNIEFLGRVDHQVKIRGFRIELAEIEHQLLRHPLIEQAVVVVREDEPGDKIFSTWHFAWAMQGASESP